ncbi:putative Esterase/lipase/thioesterase [Oceaniovalibus guishaninsula JLT2003]|uniref:Putative Esterase/lipase/thioesterase n=1 Tax=Oceaniovalibus guishaninsula JLT2003 TaxID=1231392 RepID=K2IA65_9RHOB|nr:alpha/beta hydrolase [Oceaniovalibus guishaninsula]EKE45860.1 putative Esterase/lipase/thioesterase [Oceaniovalibus guishaninsula JLT2003]
MTLPDPAPFHADVADGPPGGAAHWLRTADGLRLRVTHWRPDDARGTVLLFPGRTEYAEKYGPVAETLGRDGWAVMAIDWRGQGLSDRILDDPLGGHVLQFTDYQIDVAAMLGAARRLGLPRPWHLLAHSMGGAIGLRALDGGLPVDSATFSAPMWGIRLAAGIRPFAWSLSWAARHLRLDHHYAPGTSGAPYPDADRFAANMLTHDPDRFAWMTAQVERHPELALGGPSLRWLNEALRDGRRLAMLPSPRLPCLTFLGGQDMIVDPDPIRQRMAHWPGGRLIEHPRSRHEPMMECPPIRDAVFDAIRAHLESTGAH